IGKTTGEGFAVWTFAREEQRKISILEVKKDGKQQTIVIDMVTQSAPSWSGVHKMGGKLRLHYEWIADQWNLVRVENLTFVRI
ncbi:MAG: hypothetical protein WCH84_03260, partial [Verrucomicrobiota bacterium]